MKTTSDFAARTLTLTCEQLLDANTNFIEGVIYQTDLGEAPYVTPAHTFNGHTCDCHVLTKTRNGFEPMPGFTVPIPVKRQYLGEPIAVILPP